MRYLTSLSAAAAALVTTAALAAASPAAAAAPGRPGCDGVDRQGRVTLTVTSGGVQRTVLAYVPAGYDGHRRLALILDLHGSGSSAAEELSRSRLEQAAEAHSFIVAAPQGAIASGTTWSWNVPYVTAAPAGAPDDEQFLTDAITALSSSLCVDPKQVYGAGYSGGGRMISQYACDRPGLLAAIAPVAGLRAGPPVAVGAGFAPDPARCAPGRPVPVVTFAGTADPVNPFGGGGAAYWRYGTLAAQQRWAALNGCTAAPATAQVTVNVSRTAYTGCAAGADVVLYVVTGGGHTWPGGNPDAYPAGLGLVTQEISANEIMWSFFRDVQLGRIGTWFDEIDTYIGSLRASGSLSASAAASLRDRLSHARSLAVSGSETRTIGYLQQFIARAENQVKGDADDVAVRRALVGDAQSLINLLTEAAAAELPQA